MKKYCALMLSLLCLDVSAQSFSFHDIAWLANQNGGFTLNSGTNLFLMMLADDSRSTTNTVDGSTILGISNIAPAHLEVFVPTSLSAGRQPVYHTSGGANNLPYLDFNQSGVAEIQGQYNFNTNQPTVHFYVLKPATQSAQQSLVDSSASRQVINFKTVTPNVAMFAGANLTTSGVVLLTNQWNILTAVFTNGGSYLRVNGVNKLIGDAGTGGIGLIELGSDSVGANPFKGQLEAVVMYGMNPTTNDLQTIEQYLATRYGVSYVQITSQPSGGVIQIPGGSTTLSITASGATQYQWRRNGVNIAGATASTYNIASLTISDSALFDCIVSDSYGSLTSQSCSNIIVNDAATVSNWVATVTTNGGACPSITTAAAVDTLYAGLVTDGLDTKMISVIMLVPDNLIAATTPLLHTAGNNPWVNHSFVSGNLTINGLLGVPGNATYLDTGITPSVSMTLNDTGFTVYESVKSTTGISFGASGGAGDILLICSSGTCFFDEYNATAGQGRLSVASTLPGYYSGNRTSSSSCNVYFANSTHAHASLASIATTGGGLPNVAVYGFAYDNSGVNNFVDSRMSFMAIHKSLNSTQSSNFYNRIQTFRTTLGGGSI